MAAPLEWHSVRLVPILHNRLEFALEVRRQFAEFAPEHVAVEYPPTLAEQILAAVRRLPLLSVVHYREADGAFVYLVLEPTDAQVEALRLAVAQGIPVHFVDRDVEGYPRDTTPMPDPYAVARVGYDRFCEAYLKAPGGRPASVPDRLRERNMAFHLQRLARRGRRVLWVGGLHHLAGLRRSLAAPQVEVIGRRRRAGVGLAHLHADASREILTEMPFLMARFEAARADETWRGLDRLALQQDLIRIAREHYRRNSREELAAWQVRVLNRFARNYAWLTGRLVPNFYQLIVAARGAADDNFAYEVWLEGSAYPWQTEDPELPVLRLTGEDLYLDERRIRFHRRLKSLRRRLVPVPVKRRARERRPGEWQEDFDGASICSYPPEDVLVEGYGRELMHRAFEIKLAENARTEPFTCSLRDGLDIRESIRKWFEGQVYVREERPLKGKMGGVVVIFDADPAAPDGTERFPWRVTWLGEHEQESDMAFYSTPAGEVMDGPGISRCTYGGFMLTYPPMRVFDIWRDPFFDAARNKPERLLMAALDYSRERNVVYVAATPPTGWCRSMAARLGKRIIYLPIGSLSPVRLRQLREFHVLDGHHVRRYADRFIRR